MLAPPPGRPADDTRTPAPHVRARHASGRLALGLWNHWVPGANDALAGICRAWARRNHVDLSIDFIPSLGPMNSWLGGAQMRDRGGYDILTHATYQIAEFAAQLEPLDDVVRELIAAHGRPNETIERLAKINGRWYGVPTIAGSLLKPCCSRYDLYRRFAGIDLREVFPSHANRDQGLTSGWNWHCFLTAARQLYQAGMPIGLPVSRCSDSVDWIGALFRSFGATMVDESDCVRVDSEATRNALEFARGLIELNAPDAFDWDDADNNAWLVSGRGSAIINPPSAWATALRAAPDIAERCWTHDMPAGPAGRFVGYLPMFYGVWSFSPNKPAAKDLLRYMSHERQAGELVRASCGYDVPGFEKLHEFDTWAAQGPPVGTIYNYPPRGDSQTYVAGLPARHAIARQIYARALQPAMVAKFARARRPMQEVVAWAERQLRSYVAEARDDDVVSAAPAAPSGAATR